MKEITANLPSHIQVVHDLIVALHKQYRVYSEMVEKPSTPTDSISSMLANRLILHDRIDSLCAVLGLKVEWCTDGGLIFMAAGLRCDEFRDALAIRFGAANYGDMLMRETAAITVTKIGKVKAMWVKTDGTCEEVMPGNGKDFKLEEMYKFIGTDDPCIDVNYMKKLNKTIVCHDNGIAMGLPTNVAASVYCMGHINMEECGIVGDCLICDDSMVQ